MIYPIYIYQNDSYILGTHKIIKKMCDDAANEQFFLLSFLLLLFYDFGCSQWDLIGNVHFKIIDFFHLRPNNCFDR